MSTNKLSQQQRRELLDRVQNGERFSSIARDMGITSQAVSFHSRNAFGPKVVEKIATDAAIEIASRFLAGERATHLAREFNVSLSTIRSHIERQTGRKPGRNRRSRGVNPPISVANLAYLAALVDGEGCISRMETGNHKGWHVTITNTSKELRASLRPLGGRFYYPKRVRSTANPGELREQVWVWKIAAAWDVHRFLSAIEPYMRIKRERALEAISEIEERFGAPPIEDRHLRDATRLIGASLDDAVGWPAIGTGPKADLGLFTTEGQPSLEL